LDVGANWWCAFYETNESHAKFVGHPLHPAMIIFPLALTTMALIFDSIGLVSGRQQWRREARHALIAGTIGGLLAAPSGLMDWLSLPLERPVKSYGLIHGLGNVLLLAINGLNIGLRGGAAEPSPARRNAEVGLSVLANILAFGTGWLGGQLSYRFAIGVEPPYRPYRVFDVLTTVRIPGFPEWRNGRLRFPKDTVWQGPEIPSEPLPTEAEERPAAS
jgi:uncharacterized membrane protein